MALYGDHLHKLSLSELGLLATQPLHALCPQNWFDTTTKLIHWPYLDLTVP